MLSHDPYQRKTIPESNRLFVFWGECYEMNASACREDLLACLDCALLDPAGLPARRASNRASALGLMLLAGLASTTPYQATAADWLAGTQPAASAPAASVPAASGQPTPAPAPTAPSPPLPPAATSATKPGSPAVTPKAQPDDTGAWQPWKAVTGWFTSPPSASEKPPLQKANAAPVATPTAVASGAARMARVSSPVRPNTATVVGRFDPEFGPAGHFVTDTNEQSTQAPEAAPHQAGPHRAAELQPESMGNPIANAEAMLVGIQTGSAQPAALLRPEQEPEQSAVVTDEQVSLVSWLSSYYSGGGSGTHGGGLQDNSICLTDTCCPKWEVQVDALFLWQGNIQSRPLYVDSATGATALDVNQLYSPAAIAPRYAFTYHHDDCWAVETNYFQVWGFNANALVGPQLDGAGDGIYQSNNLVGPDYNKVQSAVATSSANIQSLEVNLRHTDGGIIEWISGFRWLQWGQNLSIGDATVEGFALNGGDIVKINTLNNLYGWQGGGDMMLWNAGRWLRVNGVAKAGVYYNHQSSQNTSYTDFFNPDVNVAAANDTVAFVGETGINASLALTNWLSWRAGYTCFWLGGMAVPARQLGLTNINTNTTSVNTNGSVLLHGVTTGLEARW